MTPNAITTIHTRYSDYLAAACSAVLRSLNLRRFTPRWFSAVTAGLLFTLTPSAHSQSASNVSTLNGNYSQQVADLSVRTSVGVVDWLRVFNGSGWRFNRHWDGINASYKPAMTQNTGGGVYTSSSALGSAGSSLWVAISGASSARPTVRSTSSPPRASRR